MKLIFSGAAREVTGSCHFVEAAGRKIMLDCGMEQGPDEYENQRIDALPFEIDCLLLSHAHIDHSGNIPLLVKQGFKGNIYATRATAKLCSIMLRDSAHIQLSEAEWKNRKARRADSSSVLPLYDLNDVEAALKLFKTVEYGEIFKIADGVEARYTDAGHLLGSAVIELFLTENGERRKLVYTGDLGNISQPLINDPVTVDEADYLIIESTYATRKHDIPKDSAAELAAVIQRTFDRGGNVIIPSFAVGRTQETLYYIRKIKEEGLVKNHGDFPVYVDSPLAVEATGIYGPDCADFYDGEAAALVAKGVNPIGFSNLRTSVTSSDSKLINADCEPKVIISASGMCEAGRIRHHLKHNLWRSECAVLFVGYQAEGTLGRALIDGATKVKLFGEEIAVRAEIAVMPGTSSHADVDGLLNFVGAFKKRPKRIFTVHGDEESCVALSDLLKARGFDAAAPFSGEEDDLISGELIKEGSMRRAVKSAARDEGARTRKKNPLYERLQKTAARLMAIIAKSEGIPNKELRSFDNELDTICNKYER